MNQATFKSTLIEFYNKYKLFPKMDWLIKRTALTKAEVQGFIKELIISGFLVRRGQSFYIKKEAQNVTAGTKAPQERKPRLRIARIFFKYFNAVFIIRLVMFIISIVAIYISIHYSYLWIVEFLEPLKAFLLSVCMVAYVTFALEAVFLLFKERTAGAGIMGMIILITAIFALLFSMSMTVIGQYNKKTELLQVQSVSEQGNKKGLATLEILKDAQKSAAEAVEIKRAEIRTGGAILSGFNKDDTESIEYKTQLWKLSQLNIELRAYEKQLETARNELKVFINKEDVQTEEIERADFYDWFAELTGMEKGVVEFLLYLIPALFVDIIAPLGMFIALGLYRKKKEKKK